MNIQKDFDVCVIGAGPAGLAAALTLAKKGVTVVIIERGLDQDKELKEDLVEAFQRTKNTHSSMTDAVDIGLGGTSKIWGGRCVPFDEYDFTMRSFAPGTNWPLSYQDIKPYILKAAKFLSIENDCFHVNTCKNLNSKDSNLSELFNEHPEFSAQSLERWSQENNVWKSHKQKIISEPNISILSGYICVALEQPEETQQIKSINIIQTTQPKNLYKINAKHFIIAGGGIESTRLVLNSLHDKNGIRPKGKAFIGKNYMGHPSGKIAKIIFNGDANKTIYNFERDDKTYIRRRISFNKEYLLKHKLLNTVFWLDNPSLADPSHKNGVLSAAFLALKTPILSSVLAPKAIRDRLTHNIKKISKAAHFKNILFSPISTLNFIISFVYKKYFAKIKIPGFFIESKINTYALHFHAEQIPNLNNSITLSNEKNVFGLNKIKINLNWNEKDITSVLEAHECLDKLLQKYGIGHLEYLYPKDEITAQITKESIDGFHQIGTLKMGKNYNEGATDSLGKLYGIDNLFIASSAVFPSSGQANPTLLIVALAIRQAEYLGSHLMENFNDK